MNPKTKKVERWIVEIYPEGGLDYYGSIKFGATPAESSISNWGISPKPNLDRPVLTVITPWAKISLWERFVYHLRHLFSTNTKQKYVKTVALDKKNQIV